MLKNPRNSLPFLRQGPKNENFSTVDKAIMKKLKKEVTSKIRNINALYLTKNDSSIFDSHLKNEKTNNLHQENSKSNLQPNLFKKSNPSTDSKVDYRFLKNISTRTNSYPFKFNLKEEVYKGIVQRNTSIIKQDVEKSKMTIHDDIIKNFAENNNVNNNDYCLTERNIPKASGNLRIDYLGSIITNKEQSMKSSRSHFFMPKISQSPVKVTKKLLSNQISPRIVQKSEEIRSNKFETPKNDLSPVYQYANTSRSNLKENFLKTEENHFYKGDHIKRTENSPSALINHRTTRFLESAMKKKESCIKFRHVIDPEKHDKHLTSQKRISSFVQNFKKSIANSSEVSDLTRDKYLDKFHWKKKFYSNVGLKEKDYNSHIGKKEFDFRKVKGFLKQIRFDKKKVLPKDTQYITVTKKALEKILHSTETAFLHEK